MSEPPKLPLTPEQHAIAKMLTLAEPENPYKGPYMSWAQWREAAFRPDIPMFDSGDE